MDFTVEVERSLRVLDGAIAVFDSVAGVEPQSETVWRQADRYRVPRIAFINKMDRTGADFFAAVQSMIDRLGAHPVPVQLPIGQEEHFRGVVDVVEMSGTVWEDDLGMKVSTIEIPEELKEQADEYHHQLIDAVAEHDEELLETYLTDESVGHARHDQARAPQGDADDLGHARLPRLRLQEQGRAAAARRGHRLPAEPARRPPDPRGRPAHGHTSSRDARPRTSRSRRSPSR